MLLQTSFCSAFFPILPFQCVLRISIHISHFSVIHKITIYNNSCTLTFKSSTSNFFLKYTQKIVKNKLKCKLREIKGLFFLNPNILLKYIFSYISMFNSSLIILIYKIIYLFNYLLEFISDF